MRIGIVPVLAPFSGGNYQYSLTMLETLLNSELEDEIVVFAEDMSHPLLQRCDRPGFSVRPLRPPSFKRSAKKILVRVLGEERMHELWEKRRERQELPDPDIIQHQPWMSRYFQECGVDLMLYPSANALSFETGIPYVLAVHDLQHRLQPEFPEVSDSGESEWREYIYRNGVRYATVLLADSEIGKEDILNCYGAYGAAADQVRVLPFLPAHYLVTNVPQNEIQKVLSKYSLPPKFLFYPAQFWVSKNHLRIVQAISELAKQHGVRIPILFCGSNTGEVRKHTFDEVMSAATELNVDVRYPGYVAEEDISALYAGARALVMPTFFGPTNIPLLEAWAFGCPVLTSDIRGITEQMGDAALLVDPRSVESLASGIFRLWTEGNLCTDLAERGKRRLALYTPADYKKLLLEILRDAKNRVQSYKESKVN